MNNARPFKKIKMVLFLSENWIPGGPDNSGFQTTIVAVNTLMYGINRTTKCTVSSYRPPTVQINVGPNVIELTHAKYN